MHVRVNVFQCKYNYFVKPKVTVKTIYERVAAEIGLQHLEPFGLQAYHKINRELLWVKPTKSLSDLVRKKGILFEPVMYLRLRARTIPPEFSAYKQDQAAMKVFYLQIKKNWDKHGYSIDDATEMCLLALHMLIELGPFARVAQSNDGSKMRDVVQKYFTENNGHGASKASLNVLGFWQVFGEMSTADAIFNYISMATLDYKCEMLNYAVKDFQYGAHVKLSLAYGGIELEDEDSQKCKVKWSSVRKVSRHEKLVIFKMFGDEKLRYKCPTKHMAKKVWAAIVGYHAVHLNKKYSPGPSGALFAFSNEWLHEAVAKLAKQNDNKQTEDVYCDKNMAAIIHKLNNWMTENKSKQTQICDTVRQLQMLCVEMQQQVLYGGQQRKATDNEVALMARDFPEGVSQEEEETGPLEESESEAQMQCKAELPKVHNVESTTEDENMLPTMEQNLKNMAQSELLLAEEDEAEKAAADLEEVIEGNDVKELQTMEITRRKRFAKLRLSLFEHDRF